MDWTLFVIFFLASAGAATTGAVFPPGAWYQSMDKPPWTPPNWAFPLVWTALYIGSSYAASRVAVLEGSAYAMAFWAMQIAFNTLWSPVFFGLRRFRESLFVMALLWIAVVGTAVTFFQLDLIAGLIFVPYVIWVSVAAALNLSVWRRNPDLRPLDLAQLS